MLTTRKTSQIGVLVFFMGSLVIFLANREDKDQNDLLIKRCLQSEEDNWKQFVQNTIPVRQLSTALCTNKSSKIINALLDTLK